MTKILDIDQRLRQEQHQQQMQLNSGLYWTLCLVRWLGYGFLILTFFDVVYALVPPRLMDPAWEFETFGNFVERAAIPLLGLTMAFAGQEFGRGRGESNLLKLLSWLALLLGIVYLLMIPLGIANTIRLDSQNNRQIQQFKQGLNKAQTLEDLGRFSEEFGIRSDSTRPGELKEPIYSQMQKRTQALRSQAEILGTAQHRELLKSSIKWNLGSLICGCLFLWIWRSTRPWTRLALRWRGR